MKKLAWLGVFLVLAGAGCSRANPESAQKNAVLPTITAENAAISVADQAKPKEWAIIAKVSAPERGWVVLHRYESDKIGEDIAYAQVNSGDNYNVGVKIEPGRLTSEMAAMLHYDRGEPGVYELPGADAPVLLNGAPVVAKFKFIDFNKEEPKAASGEGAQVVKEFSLTAKQFSFIPSVITVNKGDRVRLRITSADVAHGFALPDFKVSANIDAKQTRVVEFDADKTGTFVFYCNVFCGDGHSDMKGKLLVK